VQLSVEINECAFCVVFALVESKRFVLTLFVLEIKFRKQEFWFLNRKNPRCHRHQQQQCQGSCFLKRFVLH
jgi:hypothetical protein